MAAPTILASQAPYANQQFFSSRPLLGNVTHHLTMEISGSFDLSHPSDVVLDFIIYEAAVNSTIPSSDTGSQTSWIFVDDQSPYLKYSQDGWQQNPAVYMDLLHNSSIFNTTITQPLVQDSIVSLNFTGSSTVRPRVLKDSQTVCRCIYDRRTGSSHRIPTRRLRRTRMVLSRRWCYCPLISCTTEFLRIPGI